MDLVRGATEASASSSSSPQPPDGSAARQPAALASPSFCERLAGYSPLFAEFTGCALQALVWNSIELGHESQGDKAHIRPWKPVCLGMTLLATTYCFGAISGAHLNPAISFSVGLSNKGRWADLGKYMLCQTLGSFSGVALSCALFSKSAVEAVGPRGNFVMGNCIVVEFVYTTMLCVVFLSCALSRFNNPVKGGSQFYGIAIGLSAMAGQFASDDVSGGILNPGLSLALDFQRVKDGVGHGFEYATAQMFAAVCGALLFRVMRPFETARDYDDWTRATDETRTSGINTIKVLSEAVGTWYIVFTFGMTALSKSYTLARPWATGAVVSSLHYAFGDLSGGHFNPAITLSVVLSGRGKCNIVEGLQYGAVQIFSGAFASMVYKSINYPHSFSIVPEKVASEYGVARIMTVDIFFTALMCFTFLACSTIKAISSPLPRNNYFGIAYGLSLAASGFCMLKLSYNLCNPALTLGVQLASSVSLGALLDSAFGLSFEFIGGVIAAVAFRWAYEEEFKTRKGLWGETLYGIGETVGLVSKVPPAG